MDVHALNGALRKRVDALIAAYNELAEAYDTQRAHNAQLRDGLKQAHRECAALREKNFALTRELAATRVYWRTRRPLPCSPPHGGGMDTTTIYTAPAAEYPSKLLGASPAEIQHAVNFKERSHAAP